MSALSTRNKELYNDLKYWEWWSFDGTYPTSQYFKKPMNDFQSIIKKFQINSNFESFFLMCNSSLYCRGSNKEFNQKKITNFVKNFSTLNIGSIAIYFDLTIFGGGDEGFVLTNKTFYYNENDKKVEIPLDRIKSFKYLKGTSISIEYLNININCTKTLKIELGFLDKKYVIKFVELLNTHFIK